MKKREVVYRGLMILISLLFSFILMYTITIQTRNNIRKNELKDTIINTNEIKIFEQYGLPGHERYSDFINHEDTFYKLNDFYNEITDKQDYKFMEVNEYLLQKEGIYTDKQEFIHGYGQMSEENLSEFINQEVKIEGKDITISNVKGLLIGEDIFRNMKLKDKLVSGQDFGSEDFYRNENVNEINVILGNGYSKDHKVGEEFMGLYVGEEFKFKVIGIMEKDVAISTKREPLYLDNYIIIPSFNIDLNVYETSNKKSFYNIHYVNRICGYINVNDKTKVKEVIESLKQLAQKYDLDFNYQPMGATYADNVSIISVAAITKENTYVSIFSIIILCFSIHVIFVNYFNRNLKNYSIRLINGSTIGNIKKKIVVEITALTSIGLISAIFLFYIIFKNTFGRYVMISSFVITLLIEIVALSIVIVVLNNFINKSPIYLSLRKS